MTSTTTTTIDTEKKNEWLQLIEFVKRNHGYNRSEQIRINDYNSRGSESVASYYRTKFPNLSQIPSTTKLKDLLKNTPFSNALGLNEPEIISRFTEIYNDTDYLMKSLNNKEDNIYIRCNPVDDNGVSLTDSNNMNGPSLDSIDAILTEGADSFSPGALYSNVGLQIFLCLLLVGLIYGIGYVLFNIIPSWIAKSKSDGAGADAPAPAPASAPAGAGAP